jgi:hypothetical protein
MTGRKIDVVCYAGYKAEERPRSFLLEGARVEVASIVREWVEEGPGDRKRKRFFKVRGSDGFMYALYYDEGVSAWFLAEC